MARSYGPVPRWRDHVVASRGSALAVRDYGGDGEPPLLLLHGAGQSLATWDEFAPLLTSSFRVVAYDAPGHGGSPAPRGRLHLSHFLDAVDAVSAVSGLERPVLVGHSMGGVMALLYAAERRGARAIVSIDAAYVRAASDPPYIPEPAPEVLRGLLQLRANVESRLTGDDLYAAIGCPVLLVCGERGWVHGQRSTAELRRRVSALPERFPHVEVAWLDSGHMVQLERPRELAAVVSTFAVQQGASGA